MTRRRLWLAGVAAVALLVLCGWWARATVHALARDRLSRAVGPADWTVVIGNPPPLWVAGALGRVTVAAGPVTLHSGLTLAHVWAQFEDVHATPWRLTSVGAATFRVQVAPADLNSYLARRSHARVVPQFVFEDGKVQVHALARTLGLPIPGVELEGALQVHGGVTVDFVPDALQIGHHEAGALGLELVGTAINPIYDTRALPYNLTIRAVQVTPGQITVDGEAHPTLQGFRGAPGAGFCAAGDCRNVLEATSPILEVYLHGERLGKEARRAQVPRLQRHA